ncbi:lysosomal amino acid transporter 1 homolog isoform X1 [Pomacea canaliculata]|uniref:lysosomal amino acid transporter 1 homolog isoform X1 n=1 Tax=Pomacea canaliculata TaxID=400727 RepID=UPI000D725942|nr:lysosomal amino acid transporter 1 homolog isoform X1 [Pomacea canaliculata]
MRFKLAETSVTLIATKMPAPLGLTYHQLYQNNFEEQQNCSNSANCTDGVHWIWVVMNDCVCDTRGVVSTLFGIASVFIWMMVGIPQMIQNCRHIQGMRGISVFLLAQWMLGDTTNLIGCILTKQLKVQIYVAIYYVSADCVLLIQYGAYLIHLYRKKNKPKQVLSQVVLCLSSLLLLSTYLLSFLLPDAHQLYNAKPASFNRPPARTLLYAVDQRPPFFYDQVDIIGYVVGIVSSLFYIGSRLSQIVKNYRLQSTAGLSVFMFILAVLGNLTYGVAILVRSLEEVYLVRHLPWIFGSLGVIALDLTLLTQFYRYRNIVFDILAKAPLIQVPDTDCEESYGNPIHVT